MVRPVVGEVEVALELVVRDRDSVVVGVKAVDAVEDLRSWLASDLSVEAPPDPWDDGPW